MNTRSETLEEHYDHVAEALGYGAVVPLLGAGVNLCDPHRTQWVPGENLPSGAELARHLASRNGYPGEDREDLARVSQYAQANRHGDGVLYDQLHSVFDATYGYTAVHRFLAGLPGQLASRGGKRHHQLIVTTNYDDALEQALDDANEPYDLLWYRATSRRTGASGMFRHRAPDGTIKDIKRPNEYRVSTSDRTVILKIHGAVSRGERPEDSYVISEDHYIEFLTRASLHQLIPMTLLRTLFESHFLFLGYSLRDWNLRVILHQIWAEREQGRDSWAIQREVHDIDRVLWGARDVLLQEVALETYVQQLSQRVLAQGRDLPVA